MLNYVKNNVAQSVIVTLINLAVENVKITAVADYYYIIYICVASSLLFSYAVNSV